MKEGNEAVNLSISSPLAKTLRGFIYANRRKGRRNVSEVTEQLWISYLRKQGVKLPPMLKR